MGLFGKNPEKEAQIAAARAEVDRMAALSPTELALEVLPVLGSDAGKKHITGIRLPDICKALMGDIKVPLTVNTGMIWIPVKEALQRLEHANLVMQMASGVDQSSKWRITSTGEQALADNTVAQQLA